MRKLYLALAGAAALGMASAGNAAVVVTSHSFDAPEGSVTGPSAVNGGTTIGFSQTGITDSPFTEWLTFTNTEAGLYDFVASTSSDAIDFTSVILSGGGSTWAFGGPVFVFGQEAWGLEDVLLAANTAYTVTITGTNTGTGAISGNITINQAIPEPGTWAMMLLGFAAVGYQIRKRRRPALMQLA